MSRSADDFDLNLVAVNGAQSPIAGQGKRGMASVRRFHAGRGTALDNARPLADIYGCSGRDRPTAAAQAVQG